MDIFAVAPITTERLVLRPVRPADFTVVQRLFADDPEVTDFVAWKPMEDEARARRFAEGEARAWADEDDCRSWIAWRHDEQPVGSIIVRKDGARGEFSYVIDRAYWKQGYATEMVCAILDRARLDVAISQLRAVCDVAHIASQRVLEKAGLCRECVLSKHQRHNIEDDPRDCFRYTVEVV